MITHPPQWLIYLLYALSAGYFIGMWVLTSRADRFKAPSDRWPRPNDIMYADRYTAEGQPARQRAARFTVWGLAALVLAWILSGAVH